MGKLIFKRRRQHLISAYWIRDVQLRNVNNSIVQDNDLQCHLILTKLFHLVNK